MSVSRRTFLKTVAGVTGSLPFLHASAQAAGGDAMPKRKFGRHDEMLSVVGLGGQTLGAAKDITEARRIAQHAIDRGVTFFENSWDYHGGRAEEWMGEALKGSRDKIFLMTQVTTHCVGIDKYEYVDPLVAAASKTPMTVAERDNFVARLKADGCEKYAVYLHPGHVDGQCSHAAA
jgi:hypothetical protein